MQSNGTLILYFCNTGTLIQNFVFYLGVLRQVMITLCEESLSSKKKRKIIGKCKKTIQSNTFLELLYGPFYKKPFYHSELRAHGGTEHESK